jgi:hypothetical protein
MWWSLDRQTFYLKGRPIELGRFCTMAQSVVVEAAQVLREQVLWMQKKEKEEEKHDRLSIELAAIQDDVTFVQQLSLSSHLCACRRLRGGCSSD